MSRQRVDRSARTSWPFRDELDRWEDVAGSLKDSVNGAAPLVRPGDALRRPLEVWCAPCGQIVGHVQSFEVGARLPGHAPYLVFCAQVRDSARGTPEAFRWYRVLLTDAGEPSLAAFMAAAKAARRTFSPPNAGCMDGQG